MKPVPFFMIVNVGEDEAPRFITPGKEPRYMHDSRASAEKECLRLSTAHHGNFVILQAVAYAEWRTELNTNQLPGREEWAKRMGLGVRIQTASIQPLDNPDVPF